MTWQADEKEPLPQFCERLFKFINEHDVDKLVIDLSSNQGGDGRLNSHVVQALSYLGLRS